MTSGRNKLPFWWQMVTGFLIILLLQGCLAMGAWAATPAPVALPDKLPGDKWAVVIGISKFADSRVPQLKYSAKDARDFADYLLDPKGGGFRKDHVRVLLNEEATKFNIVDALCDSFLHHAVGPNDLVVVYLSTHGSPSGEEVSHVIAYDTNLDKLFTSGIEMRQLVHMVRERTTPDAKIMLVLDACYSGSGAGKGLVRTNINQNAMAQAAGGLVISSSTSNQRSWESDTLQNSYFTRYLIECLKEKPPIAQAFPDMAEKVQSAVRRDKGELQTPVKTGSGAKAINMPVGVVREAPILDESSGVMTTKPHNDFAGYGQRVRTALSLAEKRQYDEAAHEIEEAIKLNDSSVDVYLLASDLYDQKGKVNEAYEAAKHAVRNGEESALARVKLSRAFFRKGDSYNAKAQAEKAVIIDPNESMAYTALAMVNLSGYNKADEAEKSYLHALELNQLNVRALVGLSQLYMMQGRDIPKAEQYLRQAIKAQSDDWEAQLELGRLLYRYKGELKEAQEHIKAAIEYNRDSAIADCELGTVMSMLGPDQLEQAEEEFRKGLKLDPNSGTCHLLFANFLNDHRHRLDEAEKEYRLALKNDPNLDEGCVRLGDLVIRMHHSYDEADTLYKKALQVNPRNAGAYVGLAIISGENLKDYASAEQNLQKAILLLDKRASYVQDLLGLLLQHKLGRLAEARKAFDTAVLLDPKNAPAHYHLGLLMLQTAKPKVQPNDALAEFKTAAEIDPNNSTYQTKVGWLLEASYKNHDEALKNFKRAIELNVADSEAHYRLGMLLIERFGQRKSGEAELRTAYEQNPKNPEIEAAYNRFAR